MTTLPSYNTQDTIYALSSGAGKGGVAVIRVSGKKVLEVVHCLTRIENPKPRYAYFTEIKSDGIVIDKPLMIYFKGPHSFTGEDVVEFHVHGGRGVINAVMGAIGKIDGCRPAEPGEYSRRAVIAGKMDLTKAEGLMDLIDAETELQRAQALSQMDGKLSDLYEGWRADLKHHMAYLEAFIDFPEEEIPQENLDKIDLKINELICKIKVYLDDNKIGQRLREGFLIAIVGVPNVGKSSLINALTKRDVAIVSQSAGTTRDVVEAHLDVAGFPVILADTAGLREGVEEIESEGIRRAVKKASDADLILHVLDAKDYPHVDKLPDELTDKRVLTLWNKTDALPDYERVKLEFTPSLKTDKCFAISAKTGVGINVLWDEIKLILSDSVVGIQNGAITRERYRTALKECVKALESSLHAPELELKAEDLRMANRALGRITGVIDADELLDVIFRDFCIGK